MTTLGKIAIGQVWLAHYQQITFTVERITSQGTIIVRTANGYTYEWTPAAFDRLTLIRSN